MLALRRNCGLLLLEEKNTAKQQTSIHRKFQPKYKLSEFEKRLELMEDYLG